MSCNASKAEPKPSEKLEINDYMNDAIARAAVEHQTAALIAAGVRSITIDQFLVAGTLAITPEGGNREKSDAAITAIAEELKKKFVTEEVELGAVYRCPDSQLQVIVQPRQR